MTAGELVVRLEQHGQRVKPRANGGWRAQCPAHDGRRLSLAISVGREGRQLVHCFAGCAFDDIRSALDLPREAFDGWRPYVNHSVCGRSSRPPFANAVLPRGVEAQLRARMRAGSLAPEPNRVPSAGLLAAHAHGDVEPVRVVLGLPRRARAAMRLIVVDMELLFGLRFAVGELRALPYASRPAAERCGLEDPAVRDALRRLAAGGAVTCVASSASRGGRRPSLYLPGPGAEIGGRR